MYPHQQSVDMSPRKGWKCARDFVYLICRTFRRSQSAVQWVCFCIKIDDNPICIVHTEYPKHRKLYEQWAPQRSSLHYMYVLQLTLNNLTQVHTHIHPLPKNAILLLTANHYYGWVIFRGQLRASTFCSAGTGRRSIKRWFIAHWDYGRCA